MIIKTKSGELKEIIYNEKQLYNYGINRLAEKNYLRQMLLVKMKRLQPDETMINSVLDKLELQKYLSDERFINSYVNRYSHKESVNKIKMRLLQKGAKKEDLEQYLPSFTKDENIETGMNLLIKKFKSYDDEKKDKMIRFLVSKGYQYDTIKKSLEMFKNI